MIGDCTIREYQLSMCIICNLIFAKSAIKIVVLLILNKAREGFFMTYYMFHIIIQEEA